MSGQILLVDDDATALMTGLNLFGRSHKQEFRIADTVNQGLELIHSDVKWTAAIFDLVLPVGDLPRTVASPEELDSAVNMQGGLLLALVCLRRFPGVPVVVWSFAPMPHLLAPLVERRLCLYVRKHIHPETFDEIRRYLESKPKRVNVMRELWDALVIEPNAFGVGVNIRAMVEKIAKEYPRRRG